MQLAHTFSIALAISSPTPMSELALIVATFLISSLVDICEYTKRVRLEPVCI